MSKSLFTTKNDNNMFIVLTILIFVLVSDTMISQVSDLLAPQLVSDFSIALFYVFVAIFGITQYLVLQYTKRKISYQYVKSSSTRLMYKIVTVVQYSLLAIVLMLVIQIVLASSYSSYILVALTIISYSLSVGLMVYFAKKFLSWYLSNRQSIIVLLYAISFALIAITSSFGVSMDLNNFASKPTVIYPTSTVEFPSNVEGTPNFVLSIAYHYLEIFSFIFVWGATVLLLHEYIRTWRLRHWILVCIPLVYFLSTFIDYAGLYNPSSDAEWLNYYVYASLNSTAGGVFFGFAFLVVARNIHNEIVKGCMTITAFGFVLLFISNQVTLVASSFPPFGAVTISYFGLSSYLIVVGLYTSALSVSQDAFLRKSIKKSVIDKSLLGYIGTAEMQIEIEKWVRILDRTDNKTNVSPSMNEDDIKLYIQDVVSEVRKKMG